MPGTKNKVSKVDYTLLYKKEITDYLQVLKDKNYSTWQMDETMKKLFSMGDLVIPVCLSKLRESDEVLAPIVCYALEYANDFDLIEPLMEILTMSEVSDKVKARVLSVLTHYGVDAGELPIEMIMRDFEKVASESMAELLDDIQKDYFLIPYILDDLEEFSLDMKLAYIKDIGEQRDEKAIPLLEIIARINDIPVAQEAVKALGKIKSGKSLFILNKIGSQSVNDNIKKIAFREAQRLKFSGVQMEVHTPIVKLSKPVKVIISSIDGLGSRAIWAVWKNPLAKRKLCSMNLLVSVEMGIKDCWGISQITAREFNASVKDLSKTTVIAESDIDYALILIKDALFCNLHKDSDIPYQFYFWKHLLEQNYSFHPVSYKPALEKYDLEEIANNREYFERSFDLFDYGIFNDWYIAEPRVYDYADENCSKKRYALKKMTYQKAEKLFSRFTQELIEPNIDLIKRMLELSTDFLERAGQKGLVKVAISALLSMDQEPLYHHPFIQRMVIESIRVALNNMKNGFDMRVNPDAFE